MVNMAGVNGGGDTVLYVCGGDLSIAHASASMRLIG
jgi:hypothetical protein